jgi:ferric-dicitrate binding protein FerR (iron transport regulator)
MMKYIKVLCVVPIALLLALAGVAFGSAPVATVASAGTFDLHGAAVRTEGVPFWPVMAGDEIATHGSSALVRFQDGTSVALGENSRAKVETVDNILVFRLSGGTMQVTAAKTSAVKFYDGAQSVAVRSGVNPRVGRASPLLIINLPPPPPPPQPVSGR